MKSAYLVQSLPLEGKVGFINGGYSHTMTARELIGALAKCHGLPQDQPLRVIGVGATESLGNEMTYVNGELHAVFGDSGRLESRPISLDSRISFSQIALESVEGVTQRHHFDHIPGASDGPGGGFQALLDAIGGDQSLALRISANTQYVKSRGACPIVEETGQKISQAVDIQTMLGGGAFTDVDAQQRTLRGRTQHEEHFDTPQRIEMVGVITGRNMAENLFLKGLHLHSAPYGHMLDFGALRDVDVEATPITKTFMLLPERDRAGNQVWHTALQEEHLPSLQNFQRLAKSWVVRESNSEALHAAQEAVRGGADVTRWAEYLRGRVSDQQERGLV